MDISTILLALVVIGIIIWLKLKTPPWVGKLLQKMGVVLLVIAFILGYLAALAVTGLFALLSILFFALGNFLSLVGEKGTLVSLPAFSAVWKFGIETLDASRTRK